MDQQRARSKSASAMKGDVFGAKGLEIKVKESKFVGYQDNSTQAKILAILKDGKFVNKDGELFSICHFNGGTKNTYHDVLYGQN